jgi:hypothetical protein
MEDRNQPVPRAAAVRSGILRAIARLEHRLAEAEFEARACRSGIAELRDAAIHGISTLDGLWKCR